MKSFLIASAGLFALALQPAAAADLPAKAPIYKAPPVEVGSWSGFYVGLNGGYSWGRSRTDVGFNNTITGATVASTSDQFNLNGGVFGGQLGFNMQSGQWVWGVEADAQWTGQSGSDTSRCAVTGTTTSACLPGATFIPTLATTTGGQVLSLNQKLQWFSTVRGRLGMAIAPTWLVYGTGGFAFGTVKTDTTFNGVIANTIAGTAVSVGASASQSVGGWTLGAGIEGRITGNLTAKAEYLYIDLGSVTGTTSLAPSVPIAATWSSRVTDNIFRVGLNYQFGASPVVARY